MSVEFAIKPFAELTLMELYEIMCLRDLVFVVGQKITSEPEVDGRDPDCWHAMLRRDGKLVGTTRVFAEESPKMVGRVAIHPDLQGGGLGTVMMRHVQAWLGDAHAELHAQAHLERWYGSLGWVRFGDVFEEAEIPHVMMRLN